MAQPKRRVSYVIPPPTDSVPRLQLPPYGSPRLGTIGPLLTPVIGQNDTSEHTAHQHSRHPRHRLGVASLALDTSTQLVGKSSPEGILYTGGRDGLVISWDLGIGMKKRVCDRGKSVSRKWEMLTGWADDVIEEEGEDDDRIASDGDILGDVNYRRQRTPQRSGEIPYEHQWETDLIAFKPGLVRFPISSCLQYILTELLCQKQRSHFRQRAEVHSDWVNDIALCNYNQTIVSASSDGTVKAWNPHSSSNSDPIQIGSHNDYVRCLTYWCGHLVLSCVTGFNVFIVANRTGSHLDHSIAPSNFGTSMPHPPSRRSLHLTHQTPQPQNHQYMRSLVTLMVGLLLLALQNASFGYGTLDLGSAQVCYFLVHLYLNFALNSQCRQVSRSYRQHQSYFDLRRCKIRMLLSVYPLLRNH